MSCIDGLQWVCTLSTEVVRRNVSLFVTIFAYINVKVDDNLGLIIVSTVNDYNTSVSNSEILF